MSRPSRVAVVIPCFNHGEYLPEAVASVEQAGRDDIEIIVVDDGSTDHQTGDEIGKLAQRGVKVIRQENRGLAAARNVGIASTNAEYIFPLDADDRMRTKWLARGIEILDRRLTVGIVYGDAECFGIRTGPWNVGPFDEKQLLSSNYIHASALYRRVIWEQNGGYDGGMPVQGYEDWDLWLGALGRGWQFEYIPDVFFDYRQHERSMITHASAFLDQIADFAARKHGALYRQAYLALLKEHRILGAAHETLAAERRSVKSTSRVLGGLLKSRLWRRFNRPEGNDSSGNGHADG